jgi:D-alanine-D-alanine ligase
MENLITESNIPVLMLSNADLQWSLDDVHEAISMTETLISALQEIGHPVSCQYVKTNNLPEILSSYSSDEYIVFNWCEELPGVPYSAALVAQELEHRGYTYTGSDSIAIELGQDKHRIKHRLKANGIPTPAWQTFTSAHIPAWSRFPAIVKPSYEHCSFGITREAVVQSMPELIHRVHYVLDELNQPAIVEDFIDGREFHAGVIGNGEIHVLPPAEIDYSSFDDIHDRLCTYQANFDKTSLAYQLTKPKLPANLSCQQLSALKKIVSAAYRAANCRDYARMDIRLRGGTFYILDVNHNADLSPDTSIVLGANMLGLSYGMLGSLLINLAAQRHPKFNSLIQKKKIGDKKCLVLLE